MKYLIFFLFPIFAFVISFGQQNDKKATKEYITESILIAEPDACSAYVTVDEDGKLFKNQTEISETLLLEKIRSLFTNCKKNATIKYFIGNSENNLEFDIWQIKTLLEEETFLNKKARLRFSKSINLLSDSEWNTIQKEYSTNIEFNSCCSQE